MWRFPRFSFVAVLLPIALLLVTLQMMSSGSGGEADAAPAPTFGLLTATNGSDIFTTLLLDHVQAKINALEVIADLIAIAGSSNSTG